MKEIIFENMYDYYNDLITKIDKEKKSNYISINKSTILEGLLFTELFNNINDIANSSHYQVFSTLFLFENIKSPNNIQKDLIRKLLLNEVSILQNGKNDVNVNLETYLQELLIRLRTFNDEMSKRLNILK